MPHVCGHLPYSTGMADGLVRRAQRLQAGNVFGYAYEFSICGRILTSGKDLFKRQVQTWEKIPTRLQERILNVVRAEIRDRVTQNHGLADEDTTGFKDDLEALEVELNMRDATQKGKQASGKEGVDGSTACEDEVQTVGSDPVEMRVVADVECVEKGGEAANEVEMNGDSRKA